ncbi:MAG TPA: RNA 2',3'-cyclic phosphodiesterase [Blastocatellia bacterium]|nr:RNA 2',3'-cyclic phosphodiesterase [Blastocatellia bacterium]
MSGSQDREEGEGIRTFICIEIPESVKERIAELQRHLRQLDSRVSWTKPSNIHLTLKFLGDVSPSRKERVRQATERSVTSITPFEIEVGGAGCFPSPRAPRVLWVGLVTLPESLKQLRERLEEELFREGFARESKRFSPHLTIGRVRDPRNSSRLAEELQARGFESEKFQARELIVMRSELKPTGSVYTAQATISLR